MIDCSRNAVYTTDAVKRLIDEMQFMGYNMLMLYTEDTYEIEGEPYFGHFRGRYSIKELQELDSYAKEHGIELMPCIQTLAHLARIAQHDVYSGLFDINDILLVGDERVYDLIDKMFTSCEKAFTSRRINIGMDEAIMLGMGKYMKEHGLRDRYEIIKEHLARVAEIAKKHGFQPIMWSDMFFRHVGDGDYRTEKIVMTEKQRELVPDNVGIVYWDYYSLNKNVYDMSLKNHKIISDNVWYAGGIWCWNCFVPHNASALMTDIPAIESCIENGVRDVFFTLWGDGGAECDIFACLPAMFYMAKYAQGERDDAKIKADFESRYGIPYDTFMNVEMPDRIKPKYINPDRIYSYVKNPSKYMLYNDPFLGRYDSVVQFNEAEEYKKYVKELEPLTKHEKYGYLFRMSQALCKALQYKYDLGARARKAYQNGDRTAMKEVLCQIGEAKKAIDEFHDVYRDTWMHDKKPQGFEVIDVRLGGLVSRLTTCGQRLMMYLDGKLTHLEELDEKMLCCDGKGEDFVGNIGFFGSYAQAETHCDTW